MLLDTHSKISKAFHEQNIFSDLEEFKKDIIQNKKKEIFENAKDDSLLKNCIIF